MRFEDGKSGYVDLTKIIDFKEIFEKLKDKNYFSQVKVNEELGRYAGPIMLIYRLNCFMNILENKIKVSDQNLKKISLVPHK